MEDENEKYLEPDDLITDWLRDNNKVSPESVGIDTIPYTKGVYIALDHRRNRRHKYLGWFFVSMCEKPMPKNYKFLCTRNGMYLYGLIDDDLPE
jgi:hypothetical protein